MSRRGIVSVDGVRAGVIEERPDGGTTFRYDTACLSRPDAKPVSGLDSAHAQVHFRRCLWFPGRFLCREFSHGPAATRG